MPTPDPGFQDYLRRQARQQVIEEPHIETTEYGWVWMTQSERHELFAPFCTVHVRPIPDVVLGEN